MGGMEWSSSASSLNNNMKKIFLITILGLAAPVFAHTVREWALIDSSGTVINVRLSDTMTILDRNDGPWVKAYKRVGIGYHYDGLYFTAPAASTGTFKIQPNVQPNKKTKILKTRSTKQKPQ
jgi:hypothetical protein